MYPSTGSCPARTATRKSPGEGAIRTESARFTKCRFRQSGNQQGPAACAGLEKQPGGGHGRRAAQHGSIRGDRPGANGPGSHPAGVRRKRNRLPNHCEFPGTNFTIDAQTQDRPLKLPLNRFISAAISSALPGLLRGAFPIPRLLVAAVFSLRPSGR